MALELMTADGSFGVWVDGIFGSQSTLAVQLLEIIGINIVLSGDNAVVIAIACRSLPPAKRKWGIILGAGAAIVLRIIFTVGLQQLLVMPYLKLIGGLLLVWIAIQLLFESEADDKVIADHTSLMGAIRTIAIADMVMSLDNVIAIAAAAHGRTDLIIFGLALSIPLIIGGATLIITILTRFPILVWAGGALLGWVAGELLYEEAVLQPVYQTLREAWRLSVPMGAMAVAAATAIFVVVAAWAAKLATAPRRTTR